ncbi:hypothetical protein [uncultured Marinobacter sp.]|uniref:hypothetical protein n=1 Tax=uncultured Marinobacter sp. TaxID=187379 RepID=UPI0030DC72F7
MAFFSTRLGKCLLMTSLVAAPFFAGAEVIFEENFDDQPDWHSGLPENNTGAFPVNGAGPDRLQRTGTHVVPMNWHSVYQDPTWAPSTGHPDRHETIEILSANSDKARGNAGKSFVQRRDSSRDPAWKWNSDGQLLKLFREGYESLYIEFWIRFDPDWTVNPSEDMSKIFRVGSWSESGSEFQAFGGGEQGPLFLWDWKRDTYGVRNMQTLRGGPHGENYTMTAEQKGSHPRGSLNFTRDIAEMGVGGGVPNIIDRVNGGYISDNLRQTVEHYQIYGKSDWTKIAFYVQMNSSPGAADGWLVQWVNDEQIVNVRDIIWVDRLPDGTGEMVKWNFFSIGGNDYFKSYTDDVRRQEWYSIDDLVVRTSIPDGLKGLTPPSPPASVIID